MDNKILYAVIIILLVVIIGGGAYFFLDNRGQKTGAPNPPNYSVPPVACTQEAKACPDGSSVGRVGPDCEFAPCPSEAPGFNPAVSDSGPSFVPSGPLSEQPNQAKFNEYLTDIYLGKMAFGEKIGADSFPIKTNIFTAGTDQFCTMMTIKKTIPTGKTANAIYF